MKIGFDAKRAVQNNTGLGNYSRLVIDSLSEHFPDNDYMLYAPRYRENIRLTPILQRKNVRLLTPSTLLGHRLPALWRVNGMARQAATDGVTLFHGLSGELPFDIVKSGITSVVTIHDLIFRHMPQCYKAIDRAIYDYKFKTACRNATRIIAISECTKRDIMEFYGTSESLIDVVYQGCHEIFSQPISDSLKQSITQKYGLPQRYIIAVGTVEERKNQLLAVKAMRGLPDDIKLVIVGGCTPYADTIKEYARANRLSQRIIWLQGVPFAHLPALYAMACVSSYTSRFEGFGIPIIESLSVGTPVVACTGSVLEEAGGDGAVYVSPDDIDGYVHAVNTILEDSGKRKIMVTRGLSHVTKFNHAGMTQGIMSAYCRALNQ